MQLFAFADRYHEALEFEVLSYKKMPRQTGGAFHACLEFANPWSVPVWTFFASHHIPAMPPAVAAADTTAAADGADVEGAAATDMEALALELMDSSDADGGASCCCEGFAATSDVGRGEVVLMHLLAVPTDQKPRRELSFMQVHMQPALLVACDFYAFFTTYLLVVAGRPRHTISRATPTTSMGSCFRRAP
jgi:hypothetical protein